MENTTKVWLDHSQRLNLEILIASISLESLRLGEMEKLWDMMDRLELNREEKEAIGLVNGYTIDDNGKQTPQLGWDSSKTIPDREYDFTDTDIEQLRIALQAIPKHKVGLAKPWMRPLLKQLPQLVDGHK